MKIPKKCLVLLGAAGAGKDTVAKMIKEYVYGTRLDESYHIRFSDPLKVVVAEMFGLDYFRLGDQNYKASPLPDGPIWLPSINKGCECEVATNPRELLQWFGTDFGRAIDEDIWVKAALKQAHDVYMDITVDFMISTDCRFPNEAEALRKTFDEVYFVRLHRVGVEVLTGQAAAHASETEAQTIAADVEYHIESGDFDHLRRVARQIAEVFLKEF